jgi:hypothetical protein
MSLILVRGSNFVEFLLLQGVDEVFEHEFISLPHSTDQQAPPVELAAQLSTAVTYEHSRHEQLGRIRRANRIGTLSL